MNRSAASRHFRKGCLAGALTACLAIPAHADDIDVYTASSAFRQKPNILFVLDYSGSMGSSIFGGPPGIANPARIDILKQAMSQVLDQNLDRINAGVGSLYSTSTTGIRWPISELTADAHSIDPAIQPDRFTVRDIIKQQIDERGADGWTATVDALVEAAQYFRGDAVTHNDRAMSNARDHQPDTWDRASLHYSGGNSEASLSVSYSPSNAYAENHSDKFYCNDYSGSGGPNFCADKSVSQCVVKSTDDKSTTGYDRLENLWGSYQRCEYQRGLDWVGARYNSPITQSCQANAIVLISDGEPTLINDGASLRSLIGTGIDGCEDLSSRIFNGDTGTSTNGNCGPEVLRLLSGTDQVPGIRDSRVKTYTVGFNIGGSGQDYLTLLAEAGKGMFFKADRPDELTDALNSIVDEILGGSESFAELSIDVDRASFAHGNRAFLNLFSPSVRRSWKGNLKGYFVDRTGLIDINGRKATVETDSGVQFAEETQSFWSSSNDGNDVRMGGASEQLLSGARNLYTYTGAAIPPGGAALAGLANNQLTKANGKITAEMMGLPSGSARRDSALDWIQTAPMGDPLHSKSVTVNYGTRQVVYMMTNQGLLHAIDASAPTTSGVGDTSGGNELFAFMPRRLLVNLPLLQDNSNTGSHIYGLDGSITRWHDDLDNDGVVNNGEKVMLVFGMRRGGEAYYALDVSKPDAPRLEWIIDSSQADFSRLAQSWSRLSLVKVRDGAASRRVLLFAAGYDAAVQDDVNTAVASRGNAIYMVDADGRLLWKVDATSHPAMKYSIASDLTVIDSDSDALADRLYVGDVAGQLWRVDFDDISAKPAVTLLASVDDGQHQPFFYAPSVAFHKNGSGDYLSISMGSGNRTSPLLSGVQHYLYMIRDTDVDRGAPEAGFTTVRVDDLFDATSDAVSSTDDAIAAAARQALADARGWKVALAPDEKALSQLVTFEGRLLATTFSANVSPDPAACGYETTGRFYSMDIASAAASRPSGNSDPGNDALRQRSSKLNSTGIPSSPVIIFSKGSSVAQVMVDKETVQTVDQRMARVFWHAR